MIRTLKDITFKFRLSYTIGQVYNIILYLVGEIMEKIKEILELGQISKYVAIVKTDSEREIRIPWNVLKPHWKYANYDEIDFISESYIDELLVICMTAGEGESGIIAVWDLKREDWIHIQKGDYVYCALILKELGILISMHYITDDNEGYQAVFASRLTNDGLKIDDDLIKMIPAEWGNSPFNPREHKITQRTKLDTLGQWLRKCGPTGLFYSKSEDCVYAHDACNLASVKIEDILKNL